MPSPYTATLSTWSSSTLAGSIAGWTSTGNAQVLDGSVAVTLDATNGYSDYLLGTGPSVLGSSFAANEQLESITINVTRMTPTVHIDGVAQDYALYLVVAGSPVTLINFAQMGAWSVGTLTLATYTVSQAQLQALGITKASITSTFGVALSVQNTTTGFQASVDQISFTFTTMSPAPVDTIDRSTTYLPGIGIAQL